MRIRLLKKSDIEKVAKLFVESYVKDEKNRRWQKKYAEKYILMIYRICKDLCFVAIEGEKIVGVSLNVILPEFNKEIISSKVLLVHPNYRKQKIGSKLLKRVLSKAYNKYELKEIETSIYTLTNFPITWYEKVGFRTKKNYEITKANISNVLALL